MTALSILERVGVDEDVPLLSAAGKKTRDPKVRAAAWRAAAVVCKR
jgi:hypothetical protein